VIVGEAQADAHWPVELEQAGSNVAGWEIY
jgi:hypothetical protein